jgi:hypothetical protein
MIQKISFGNYRQINALNMSSLVNIQKSPKHYKYCLTHTKETKALTLGRAIHSLILEPHLFQNEFIVEPKIDRRTKEGKEIAARFEAEADGKEILTEPDYEKAKRVAFSVLESPKIRSMLLKGEAEVSITQQINEVDMKFRLDFLSQDFILDLKTCQDCTMREFSRDFFNYDYHIKLAAYQHAAFLETGKLLPVIVLAAEKDDECDYQVFQIDQDYLDIGRAEFLKMLEKFKECLAKDEWDGIDKSVKVIYAPEWLTQKIAKELAK